MPKCIRRLKIKRFNLQVKIITVYLFFVIGRENISDFLLSLAATPNYVGVGCYKDRFKARSMTLLANYRDPAQNTVDWNDLETSVVKKCAQEVRDRYQDVYKAKIMSKREEERPDRQMRDGERQMMECRQQITRFFFLECVNILFNFIAYQKYFEKN